MKILILTLLFSFMVITYAKRYAVLVATSKSFLFYRHQSTLFRTYQNLITNGVPKSNIITMFYDDIADDPKNPEPGVVRNHPTGPNVYAGIKKDYTGDQVTAANFLAVLEGNNSQTGGRPVLKSGPKDNVYIYVVGTGSEQVISFPTGPVLTAEEFSNALKNLTSNKMVKKVFVDLETPRASTMVDGLIPRKDNILVSVATLSNEYPWAVFCDKSKKLCYGSLYGSACNARLERYRRMKYGGRVTLFDRYREVRSWTVYSQVHLYGHFEMGFTPLRQFFGFRRQKKSDVSGMLVEDNVVGLESVESEEKNDDEASAEQYEAENHNAESVANDGSSINKEEFSLEINDVINELDIPEFMEEYEEMEDQSDNMLQASNVKMDRDMVDQTVKQIFEKLNLQYDTVKGSSLPLSPKANRNYVKAIRAFSETCFNINENTYPQIHLGKLAAISNSDIPVEKLIKAMQEVCSTEHRQMKSIH